jgi:hypothetical protein
MALESLPKISPANFSPENDLIQVYSKKGDYVGVINPSYIKGSPSGSAGAIQFSDGSAFASDASNLFWDDTNKRLGVGTNAPVGILHLYKSAAPTRLAIDGDAGQNRLISYRTGAVQRFGLYVNNTAESGSNAGSNFAIRAYNDAGTLLSTPFFINRASGNVGVNTTTPTALMHIVGNWQSPSLVRQWFKLTETSTGNTFGIVPSQVGLSNTGYTFQINEANEIVGRVGQTLFGTNLTGGEMTARVGIRGNGSTSATTSLLVQNSSGDTAFQIKDDREITTSGGNVSLRDGALFIGSNFLSTYTHSIGFFGAPVSSAIVEIQSTTKGFLPPRMTDAQIRAIASPVNGLVAYNTTNDHLCCYQNGAWVKFNHSPM